MEVENIRYHFELYMERFYPNLSLMKKQGLFLVHPVEEMKDTSKEYTEPGVQLMWMMFLAGGQTIQKNMVVKLPSLKEKPDGFYDAGYNEGVSDCRKYLNSAGLKIKE